MMSKKEKLWQQLLKTYTGNLGKCLLNNASVVRAKQPLFHLKFSKAQILEMVKYR